MMICNVMMFLVNCFLESWLSCSFTHYFNIEGVGIFHACICVMSMVSEKAIYQFGWTIRTKFTTGIVWCWRNGMCGQQSVCRHFARFCACAFLVHKLHGKQVFCVLKLAAQAATNSIRPNYSAVYNANSWCMLSMRVMNPLVVWDRTWLGKMVGSVSKLSGGTKQRCRDFDHGWKHWWAHVGCHGWNLHWNCGLDPVNFAKVRDTEIVS
jgi:hypothetical protein